MTIRGDVSVVLRKGIKLGRGEVLPVDRPCSKCKGDGPFTFDKQLNRRRSWCNRCYADKSRRRKFLHPEKTLRYSQFSLEQRRKDYASKKKWATANPEKLRGFSLKQHFGITLEDYQRMLDEQGGVCAVCKRPERVRLRGKLKNLCVDHNHVTGKVRGLLCSSCNRAIGFAGDDPFRLRACADYLEAR